MAKVTTVQKSKEARECGRCGEQIAVGQAYRHASPGFRGPKLVRCLKSECSFRQSELTGSKLAGVYAAQEYGQEQIDEWAPEQADDGAASADELASILESVATNAREVEEEYREASQNWGDNGNEEWDQLADEIDGWCDTLENTSFDDFEGEADSDFEDWITEQRGVAQDALDEMPV